MRPEYITALLLVSLAASSCGTSRVNSGSTGGRDITLEAWYRTATSELSALARQAQDAYAAGKPDQAAKLIKQGEVMESRLLAAPRPTLEVAQAASDLDDLYGRMLFGNRHYGWARLQFQKNLARWKRWKPETEDTRNRLQQAQKQIDECDRKIEAGS